MPFVVKTGLRVVWTLFCGDCLRRADFAPKPYYVAVPAGLCKSPFLTPADGSLRPLLGVFRSYVAVPAGLGKSNQR